MDGDKRRSRLSSFVVGGLLGASAAALAAARRRRSRPDPPRGTPQGLEAFEDAPCFREVVEQERRKGS